VAQPVNAQEGAAEKMDLETYRKRFIEAMDDDFNTAQALAALFDLARGINRASEEGFSASQAQDTLKELSGVLGLSLQLVTAELLEFDLYNEFLRLYRQVEASQLLEKLKSNLPQLTSNDAINISLLNDLRNRLAHGTPSLDTLEKHTRLYSEALDWLRRQLELPAPPQALEEVKDHLGILYNSAATNTSTYISLRDEFREAKRWFEADTIRAKLGERGIVLGDTHKGTVQKRRQ
jgi:cysteinyl-tRNA synthetase